MAISLKSEFKVYQTGFRVFWIYVSYHIQWKEAQTKSSSFVTQAEGGVVLGVVWMS